jgi:2'-5' RNA ligase
VAERTAGVVTDYLDMVKRIQSKGIDAIIRDEGRYWKPISDRLPPGVRRGSPNNCFGNALDVARAHRDLIYVEGYANPKGLFPLKHAWVVDGNGTVYDVTWSEPGTEYYGIAFDVDWLSNYVARSGYTSVFGTDFIHEGLLEILKEGLPERAINSTGAVEAKAGQDYSDYVMVALRPREEVAKAVVDMDEYAEDPDDLHLTLLYLGTKEDCGGGWGEDRLYRGLYDFAINSGYRGLTGKMNGFGVFQNDDGDVLVSLWDIPGIAEFRTHLKRYLEDHGAKIRQDDHGFTPHMTLAYGEGKTFRSIPKVPSALRGEDIVFGSVWLVWGDEWTEVTLP